MTTNKQTLEHNQPAPGEGRGHQDADWILDLGPEGGVKGGEIVAEGTPENVAKAPRSFTGKYLAPLLERGAVRGKEPVAAE